MDDRFSGPLDMDSERAVSVLMYAIGTPLVDVAAGSATVDVDLSPFVSSARQTQDEFSATLNWHMELYGAAQPKARRPLAVLVNGMAVFIGLIETVNDYRLSSGNRTMSLTARTRDATPAWRELPRVTKEYPQGTQLDVIARDVAESLLTPGEVLLPALGINTPHTSMQLAGTSAWAMLETLLLPAGFTPYIDGLGRLRAWSRDVQRAPDIVLTEERLKEVNGGKSRTTATRLQVKWLDPALTYVEQQDRILGGANITAGFFQLEQKQDIWFSDDHTQRARSTRMVVRQSANSGLFNVCSEDYEPVGMEGGEAELHGIITLETAVWVPGLLAAMLATKAAGALPDIAPPFGGPTSPVGKIVQAALEFSVMVTLASMGTGVYEVWGIPYDYVHGRNTTEAYDPDAELGTDKLQTIETDFITNEAHAQAVAGREFFFQALAANSYGITIVDDLRVQVGDIIQLPDESKVFVTGFQRDLGRDAPAELSIEAFYIPATLGAQQAPPAVLPPIAEFGSTAHIGVVPLTVPFTDLSENNPTSWHWVFGDGSESFEQNPTHTYTIEGEFDVSLTATNAAGSDLVIHSEFVRVDPIDTPLVADFEARWTTGWIGEVDVPGHFHEFRIEFVNKSQGRIRDYWWDFGDGYVNIGGTLGVDRNDFPDPWHWYGARGDYTVTLTITDFDDNTTSITKPAYIIIGDREPLRIPITDADAPDFGPPVLWDSVRSKFLAVGDHRFVKDPPDGDYRPPILLFQSTDGLNYTEVPGSANWGMHAAYHTDMYWHQTASGRIFQVFTHDNLLHYTDDLVARIPVQTARADWNVGGSDPYCSAKEPIRLLNLSDGRLALLDRRGEVQVSANNGATWTRCGHVTDPTDSRWITRYSFLGENFRKDWNMWGIAEGAGKIVVVGESHVFVSNDIEAPFTRYGWPWTTGIGGVELTGVGLWGCKFIDGYFYAWGSKQIPEDHWYISGFIMRSADGVNWVDVSPEPALYGDLKSCYVSFYLDRLDSGQFVANGVNARYTSPDGENWTEISTLMVGLDDPYHVDELHPAETMKMTVTTSAFVTDGETIAAECKIVFWDERRNITSENYKPVVSTDGGATWTPDLTDLYDPGP